MPEFSPPPALAARPAPTRPALITFLILLACSIILLGMVLANIWRPLLIAAVLAGSLNDWHEGLAKKFRQRRSLLTNTGTNG